MSASPLLGPGARACRCIRRPPAAAALVLASLALAAAPARAAYALAGDGLGLPFDGIGAAFTGASARLLFEYDAGNRSAVLDYLFSPSTAPSTPSNYKGAALRILKLEVGSDANTGQGSEPAYLHSSEDVPTVGRGWCGWLAQQAVARNPTIKIFLTPKAWPAFLVPAGAGASSPFGPGTSAALAAYVANYVALFQTSFGVSVGYVGVWGASEGSLRQLQTDADQANYIRLLRQALNANGQTAATLIVCSDQSSWACASAVDPTSPSYIPGLVGSIGVLGNMNTAPPPAAQTSGLPIWISGAPATVTTNAGAMTVINGFTAAHNATGGAVSGYIYGAGLIASPYGFPSYHEGLVEASQPWSAHFYVAPALWAIAQVNQLVPPSYMIAPTSSGGGQLVNGGYYVTFFDPATFSWTLLIQKFWAQGDGAPLEDELATFTLGGGFAGKATRASVIYSSFSYYHFLKSENETFFSKALGSVAIVGDAFTLQLNRTGLYTVYFDAVGQLVPFQGCNQRDCESPAPPPEPFGTRTLSFSSRTCAAGAPGTLMLDIDGSFECTTDAEAGDCLQQTAVAQPLGPYSDTDTVPHSLSGDLNAVNVDVSLDVFFPMTSAGFTAMLGARVSPWNLTQTGGKTAQQAMNLAPGLWLAVSPSSGGLDWRLCVGLAAEALANPVVRGTLSTYSPGRWATLRLVLRGDRAIGSLGASLLFSFNVSGVAGVPTAGFVGLATGEWAPRAVSFRNFAISVQWNTCSAVPKAGAQIDVEMCQLGEPGTSFEFVPVDVDPAHNFYSRLSGWDAEDVDGGQNMGAAGGACFGVAPEQLLECYYTACSANTSVSESPCLGFNGNGWPKGSFSDLAPTGLTDLFVKVPGAGLLQLSVDPSLCITVVPADPNPPNLLLQACGAPGTVPSQMFTVETTLTDGAFLTGPITSAATGHVLDIYYLGEQVDTKVNTYAWNGGSNQIFVLDSGTIRAPQMGVCLGACDVL